MHRSHQVTEFDIVRVTPHVDLVLFDNVISCYPCDKNITANYILGQDVSPSSWDWVGIFPIDWRYLGEYMSYRWAQTKGQDCTAPRRRTIVFAPSYHQIPPNDRDLYQFLYISHGNHVVGVSAPFKITDPEVLTDFCIASLYKQPSTKLVSRKHRTRKDLTQKFKILTLHPIVQKYNQSSLVPYNHTKQLKVFDIRWGKQQTSSTSGPSGNPVAIEYPVYGKLKAGPEAFLLSLQETGNDCSSCLVAKTLVQDFVEKDDLQEEKLRHMRDLINDMMMTKTRSEKRDQDRCVGLLDWALNQVQEDNKALRNRVDDLERLLFEARSQLHERPQTDSGVLKVSDDEYGTWVVRDPKRIARIKKVVGRQSRTVQILRQCNDTKQRQISKLQSENIRLRRLVQTAFDTSDNFRALAEELNQRIKCVLADRAKDHTNDWRQFVRNVQETTTQTPNEKKEDRGTSPDSTSSTSSTSSEPGTSIAIDPETNNGSKGPEKHRLRNKQITKVLRSERQHRSKLHKDINQAEQCPTCGLKFSKKTDRRVIEEHIVFHTYHDSKSS